MFQKKIFKLSFGNVKLSFQTITQKISVQSSETLSDFKNVKNKDHCECFSEHVICILDNISRNRYCSKTGKYYEFSKFSPKKLQTIFFPERYISFSRVPAKNVSINVQKKRILHFVQQFIKVFKVFL